MAAATILFSSCMINYITMSKYNADGYSFGNFSYDESEIDTVNVEWIAGGIEVLHGKGTLSATETGSLSENKKMYYKIENNALYIKFWKSGYAGRISSGEKILSLEVPEGVNLIIDSVSAYVKSDELKTKKCDISSTSGDIDVKELSGNSVKTETTSGKIKVGALIADTAETESTSGSLVLESVKAQKIKAETTSGAITLTLTECSAANIESTSGKITLNLAGNGATVSFDTTSGYISADKAQISSGKYVFGDGKINIEATTVSGNFEVTA